MRISLTSRDHVLLSKLSSFGVLSTRQLEKLVFQSVRSTTVLRRLRKLKRSGFINRVTGLPCGELSWIVTQKGATRVCASEAIVSVSKNTLEHAIAISDVRMILEKCKAAHGWIPEHELKRQWGVERKWRKHEFTVVPDGMFGTLVSGQTRVLSLEVELHAKSKRLYRRLFEKYPDHVPIWKVWYVVPDDKIGKFILGLWKEMAPRGKEDWIVWSRLSDLKDDLLNARVYSNLGSLPISKWITLQNPIAEANARTNTAQTPAHGPSSVADNPPLATIQNHQQLEAVSAIAENSKNPENCQHYGELKRGAYDDFHEYTEEESL